MSDKEEITNTIQTYFDCMYESSSEKTRAAFHPNAKITGFWEGSLHEVTVSVFAKLVESQRPSAKEKCETLPAEILSMDIAGSMAEVRVRDDYLGNTFLDTLSLIKYGGTWSIYNKLFHVEGP
jgi:hypothetical protein